MAVVVVTALLLLSCKDGRGLEYALEQAGENRAELEKVLSHYEEGSPKRQAAEFLIGNMVGNFARDTSFLGKCRPVLLRYDSLRKARPESVSKSVLNEEWKKFVRIHGPRYGARSKALPDVGHISAAYLIHDIDRAFRVYDSVPYKDSVDFHDFLRYVLPYRKNNEYVIEPWRDYFLSGYGEYMGRYASPRQVVDSVMECFTDYEVSGADISAYPFLCLRDYELARISRCSQRCWFNSMLFSALGIPCTIDFVPAWGNRNSSHEWNALVINGKTYPFEATGGRGKWKPAKVYNNVWVDKYWMKSRLPKVFRYSYETVWQGPATSGKSDWSNTPSLFLGLKYADVSDEYFATSDIRIPIRDGVDSGGAEYAYLCVFNEDVWKPVAWGKVEGKEVAFGKMGRDIVYLPVFYDSGRLIPFNDAFVLTAEGRVRTLRPDGQRPERVVAERKYCARPDIGLWCEWNEGASFRVSGDRLFSDARVVFTVPQCKSRPNVWTLPAPVKCRYIRYDFPEEKDALAELAFYAKGADGTLRPLSGALFSSDEKRVKALEKVFDNDILTYADMNPFLSEKDSLCWAGVDFGQEVEVAALGVCPRNDKNDVIKGLEYELFYWKDSWVSLGKQVASGYSLAYDGVPSDALLLLKCTTEGRENRIFTWEGGKQKWW